MEIRFENEVYNLELSGHRRLLHEAIEDYVDELEMTDEVLEELELAHRLISNKDVKGLVDGCFVYSELVFLEVEENEILEEALRNAGYEVQTSRVSRSIYAINDEGIEVRISDHKRPAVEQNGIWMDHEYEKEIIVNNNIVYLNQLKENGFSKLDKVEYLLG
mgnify:FL=1